MKYEDLVKKTQHFPYFHETYLGKGFSQTLRNQLSRWTKQKKIIRLKRGMYMLPLDNLKIQPSCILISNVLYSPSYVSLEYALNYYELIPERATVLTAISTHKTKIFYTEVGTFSYQHVKQNLFFGYKKIKDDQGFSMYLAAPEKALLDKFYFDTSIRFHQDYFSENLRLQNLESLRIYKLKEYAKKFNSKKINKILKILFLLIQKEKPRRNKK